MDKNGFKIRQPIKIPYPQYDKTVKGTIRYGAESRQINSVSYALKRLRNYLLLLMSMTAPFNSWRVCFNKWKGVNIGNHVYIGMFVFLDNAYPEYIYIEDKAAVNAGSMIVTHLNPYVHFEKVLQASVNPVVIREGAFVAVKSVYFAWCDHRGICYGNSRICSLKRCGTLHYCQGQSCCQSGGL
jgi:hypothetical protein